MSVEDVLQRVIAQWRAEALVGWSDEARALERCADDLSAALAVIRRPEKEQEVARMASTRDVSTPDATAGKD